MCKKYLPAMKVFPPYKVLIILESYNDLFEIIISFQVIEIL